MSVQSEITRLENAKSDIATAITNKGVTVPSGTKLDGMAALIGSIESGGSGGGSGNLNTCTVILKAEVGKIRGWGFSYNDNGLINTGLGDSSESLVTIENVLCGSLLFVYAYGASIPSFITDGAERMHNTFAPVSLYKITASSGGTATLTYVDVG